MTRDRALRNILLSVFSCLTIGVKDNKIDKKISLYKKCRYNSTSLNNFRELFRIAFIYDSPEVIISNRDCEKDISPFDRRSALDRALLYLGMRGVTTDGFNKLDQQVQCEYVYSIFSKHILPAIFSNNAGMSPEEAGDVDITEHMIYAISEASSEYVRIFGRNIENIISMNNKIEDNMLDKSKPNYPIEVYYSNHKYFKIVNQFYKLSVYFIIQEDIKEDGMFGGSSDIKEDDFFNSFLKNVDNSSVTKLAFLHAFYFDKYYEFYNMKEWEYTSNIDDSQMMSNKHSGLLRKKYFYYESLREEACKHVEEQLMHSLKPYYERLCDDLEMLLNNLISLNITSKEKANISSFDLPDEIRLKTLLTEKAEKLIFDFDIVEHFLMKYRKDDYVNALFIMLQNLVCDITDFFNDIGAELSEMLSVILSKERFKKHISVMKRRLNSKELKCQKELEVRLYKERKYEYKKPESVRDILFSKQPFVYNGLYNALAEYVKQLNRHNN